MTYRRDIEGLRALAVTAVLLYHFGVPHLDGGFVGVDVFFVISGFLITSLLLHERESAGGISFSGFYARRARRLLPISATVVVATAIAGSIILPATRLPDLADEVRWSSGFGANLLLARRGADYLSSDLPPSPLQHYWSLAVEEQFYVLWPLLIALVTIGVAVGRSRATRLRVAVTMAALIGGSFALSVLLTSSQPSWSYYGLHTRAWELGLGALTAALAPQAQHIPAVARAIGGWLGLAAIGVAAATYGSVSFPGHAAALPVVGAAALLISGPVNPGSPAALLGTRPLVYLGTRSYSLYLWHWPAIILAEAHLERSLTLAESLTVAAGVFVVAELGYRLIEHPIRSSPTLVRRRPLSLSMGAGLVAAGMLTGLAVASYHPDLTTGVTATAPAAPVASTSTTDAAPVTAEVATTTTVPTAPPRLDPSKETALTAVVDALAVTVLPDNLRPAIEEATADRPVLYDNGCHRWQKTTVYDQCIFGDPFGTVTVAMWGDSHMAQWYNALDQIAIANHWRLITVTQGGCPFIEVAVYNEGAGTDLPNCRKWRTSVRQYMRDQHVDIVLVSETYGLRNSGSHHLISADQWREQLPLVLQSLRADGIEPIVIGDAANPTEVVPNCLARHRNDIAFCEARIDDEHTSAVLQTINDVTAALDVSFIDPTRWLCHESRCPTVIGDILVYRDGHHLTTTLALWLQPVIEQVLVPFVDGYVKYRAYVAGEQPPSPTTTTTG